MLYQRNSLILQSLWSVQVIYSLGVHFIFLRNSSWKTLNNSLVFLILISWGDLPVLIGADLHFRTFSLRINKDQLRLHDNLLTTSTTQPLLRLVHLIYSHLIVPNSLFFLHCLLLIILHSAICPMWHHQESSPLLLLSWTPDSLHCFALLVTFNYLPLVSVKNGGCQLDFHENFEGFQTLWCQVHL